MGDSPGGSQDRPLRAMEDDIVDQLRKEHKHRQLTVLQGALNTIEAGYNMADGCRLSYEQCKALVKHEKQRTDAIDRAEARIADLEAWIASYGGTGALIPSEREKQLTDALTEIVALDKYRERLGFAQGIARAALGRVAKQMKATICGRREETANGGLYCPGAGRLVKLLMLGLYQFNRGWFCCGFWLW